MDSEDVSISLHPDSTFDADDGEAEEASGEKRISDYGRSAPDYEVSEPSRSPMVRAWKLVNRLILLWEESYWKTDIKLLGRDTLVWMAEHLVHLQSAWEWENLHGGDIRPLTVSIRYHWTRKENLDGIRAHGLQTKSERAEKRIFARQNGGSYGDGVYTADLPFHFSGKSYGEVCLLVACLTGRTGPFDKRDKVDTVVVRDRKIHLLKSSMQCFPIFYFNRELLAPSYSGATGIEKYLQCHERARDILDEELNGMFKHEQSSLLEHEMECPNSFHVFPTPINCEQEPMQSRYPRESVSPSFIRPLVPITALSYVAPKAKISDQGWSPSALFIHFKNDTLTCQGYGKGTIVLKYIVKKDMQRLFHPNPGEYHDYLQQIAFLPDNDEGNALLKRLEEAFMKGFTFYVKSKSNESFPNAVDWHIPHKKLLATGFDDYNYTRKSGRAESGYPDPEFFSRVNTFLNGCI